MCFLITETREGDNEEAEELTQPKIKLAMWVCIQYNLFTFLIYVHVHNKLYNVVEYQCLLQMNLIALI
jgi:hypothetical protein